MASPDILDFDKLLSPISDESPTGSDVRQDPSPTSLYQSIKAERAAARSAERKSIHDGDNSEADEHWRKVLTLAPEILANESKDLEIVSWFTEALIRRHGFQGLRDGFTLIQGFVEKFWDNLYPMPDEDGIETRVSPISGLNGEGSEGVLIAPIRKVPITEGSYPGPFSFWQYQQALDIQRAPDEESRAAKAATLGFSIDDIEAAVNESSDEYFADLRDDIAQCIETYKHAGRLLDQLCGPDEAPPTRTILNVLEECLGVVNHIAKHKFPIADNPEVEEEPVVDGVPGNATAKPAAGPVNSREAAFRQLKEVADFFRKTEPHSPLSYMIEKTVKWGNMPLNELIVELIPDSSSRDHFSNLTGVQTED